MAEAFEKHYRVKELAALWGFCTTTIIRMFALEPGVLRCQHGSGRSYLAIPASVEARVHQRIGQKVKLAIPVKVLRNASIGE